MKLRKQLREHRAVRSFYKGEHDRFYNYSGWNFRPFKKLPSENSSNVIKITNWNDVPLSKSLWIGVFDYRHHIILDSEVILALAKEIKEIQKKKK